MGLTVSRRARMAIVTAAAAVLAGVPSAAIAEEICQDVGDPAEPTGGFCVGTYDNQGRPVPRIGAGGGVSGMFLVQIGLTPGAGHVLDTNRVCVHQYIDQQITELPQTICTDELN